MLWQWFKRLAAGLVVLAAAILPSTVVWPAASALPKGQSLVGELLIAAPDMGDPRFEHTVILVVQHDASGAFGIVINHPVGERPLTELLDAIGEKDKGAKGDILVCIGGPVQPRVGFVVHSTDYHLKGTIAIDGHIAMTTDPKILHDIGHKHGPKNSFFAFGYAGWGPGQLEDELSRHVWYTMIEDSKLVFDTDQDEIWTTAMNRRMRDL
ncbi:MAG TPA: YqgE/AlgH family protein [Candidatus Sulfotelmatobacter sp.]|nr:YqgE/AlgH family protein [Candidatus Sulfotelmatobacter sp.]